MLSTKKKITAALTLTIAGAFALSACSMGSSTPAESSAAMEEQTPSATPDAMTNDGASNLVGPGCAAYADAVPSGAGRSRACRRTRWLSPHPTTPCSPR